MKLTLSEAESLATVYNMLREINTAGNDTILMAQCLSTMNKMFPIAVIEEPEGPTAEEPNPQEKES